MKEGIYINLDDMVVNIVDAPCGCYKTTSAINMMNENKNERYLYITPYNTEVQRIIESCSQRNFVEPLAQRGGGRKIISIARLIKEKRNISSTHSLFGYFNSSTIDLNELKDYVLVMDEVANVVDELDITPKDTSVILDTLCNIDENGLVSWKDPNYFGKYDEYKRLADLGMLSVYGKNEGRKMFIWMFPAYIFKSFKKVYILTYMFNGQLQRCYYDLHNIKYKYIYVKDEHFTEEYQIYNETKYKNLIHILEHPKLNSIGDNKTSLSSSWYKNQDNNENINRLKLNMSNYIRRITKAKTEDVIWTVFEKQRRNISGKGYTKGFVSLGLRATNLYSDRTVIAYLVNVFINPIVKNFFLSKGIDVDENTYALSELIQFIFRSAVRNDKEINIYLPSKRMRLLLINWLENGYYREDNKDESK